MPPGPARCAVGVPVDENGCLESFTHDATTQTLRVDIGAFEPVPGAIYAFEVSASKWRNRGCATA